MCGIAGYVAIAERRYREALAWLDEALVAARSLNDPRELFVIQGNQGLARLFLHEFEDAGQHFCDALAACRDAGHQSGGVDETLLGLAAVEASRRQLGRAARLTGAAKAHQARHGFVDEATIWSRLVDDFLAPARDRCGPERWDLAERAGAELTQDDAIDLALERGRFARVTTHDHGSCASLTGCTPLSLCLGMRAIRVHRRRWPLRGRHMPNGSCDWAPELDNMD